MQMEGQVATILQIQKKKKKKWKRGSWNQATDTRIR